MSTISIPCKLLCASVSAYAIDPTSPSGQYNPVASNSPYIKEYNALGFIETPYVITDLIIEAALVGKTSFGIVVAFRGTLPPELNWDSALDWIQDFLAFPTDNINLPGEVHEGFLFALISLADGIRDAITALDGGNSLPIYITGHSKGGGIAPIAAMYFKNAFKLKIEQVVTFAGPNCGNTDFVNAFNQTYPDTRRYENYLDIIPLLPPDPEFIDVLEDFPDLPQELIDVLNAFKNFDYEPVGNLIYIDSYAIAVPYSASSARTLLPIRMGEIALQLAENWRMVVSAHHPGCGYRYMEGTCSGTVCQTS
ncbi:Lipase (class 3) [compost metagenome]